MKYQLDTVYHIFNQGNNKQLVYHSRANYLYFLGKISKHILPVANILAYCLMPNHFHLLIMLKPNGIKNSNMLKISTNEGFEFQQEFSKQLAILLRSYTRGVNKEKSRSGSIFRQKTKSKIVAELPVETDIHSHIPMTGYLKECFDYIHNNPVKAGLVFANEEWSYSSFNAYRNNDNSICNLKLSSSLGIFIENGSFNYQL